jgi:DNA-binding winged helix-turn-helix (wHTH) protein
MVQRRNGTLHFANHSGPGWESRCVVPTVYLVGEERLSLIPEYLNLGTVVVVAPDSPTLRRWAAEQEQQVQAEAASEPDGGAVIDMDARQIRWRGNSLPLSQLEFRVLAALLTVPRRAWSFQELRVQGWGDGQEVVFDPYMVKALIQRLRRKLLAADASLMIEAIRGYGFRIVESESMSSATAQQPATW